MICKNCGFEITDDNSKFCPNCGAQIKPQTESVNYSQQQATPARPNIYYTPPQSIAAEAPRQASTRPNVYYTPPQPIAAEAPGQATSPVQSAEGDRKKKRNVLKILAICAAVVFIISIASGPVFEDWRYGGKAYDSEEEAENFYGGYAEKNENTSGVLPIVKFSERYNISPTRIDGIYQTYNGTVSADKVLDYANYLATRGYQRNMELENENKDFYDYLYIFEGDTDKQTIILTYLNSVFIISYQSECVYENAGGNSGNYGYSGESYYNSNVQLDCPICYGAGEVSCSSCDGSGYYYTVEYAPDYGGGSSSYEVKHTCNRCNGSGFAMCTHCSGTGKVG